MKNYTISTLFLFSFSTLFAQNIQVEIGLTRINEERAIWNTQRGLEINLHKVVPIKENRLKGVYGLGFNLDINSSDCFERFVFEKAPPISTWPYIYSPDNCELRYQSKRHNINAQLGLTLKVLKSQKFNIELQAINKISVYDKIRSHFEDGNLIRIETEREILISEKFMDDFFIPQLKLLFDLEINGSWLKLGVGNTFVRRNDERFSVNLGIEI